MTLLILLLLILIALVCSLVRWRKTALVMGTLAAFLFVGIGCGPIPAALLGHLQEGYSSTALIREAHSTAIILLGNGTERLDNDAEIGIEPTPLAYGRIVKALEIYRACKQKNPSCTIVVTGGDPQHHGATEADVYGALLQRLGVESSDLLLETRSQNTWQNAQYTAALLKSHPAEQVFLVTSSFHLRRSVLYFGRFGIQGQPVRGGSVTAESGDLSASYNFLLTDLAIHEYVGVWRYYLYEAMGWNAAATRAGSA